MSLPQNVLNHFRSYSYHQILVVCDGTETAEKLSSIGEITAFDHERASERYAPQQLPGERGQYIVLINGSSDIKFTIKSAKWSTVVIPTNTINGQSQFGTMAVDGELSIVETGGVSFLNVVADACTSLGTDPNGVCFLLKTIFIGHRDDGQTEMITNIRPLLLMCYDIGALFDTAGTEYVFSFAGMVNGAAKLPHVSSIADGFTFNMVEGASLQETIEVMLPQKLNQHYKRYKQNLILESKRSGVDVNFDDFMEVEYQFKLDPQYKNYTVGTNELAQKANKHNDPIITMEGDSTSIESLLESIMISSDDVVSESKRIHPNLEGRKFTHKITSCIKSSPDHYIVEFQIQRFELAMAPSNEGDNPQTFSPDDETGIEFDYIFTGKNIDIVTFDMKLEMGMSFFQTLINSSSVPNATQAAYQQNPSTISSGVGSLVKGNPNGAARPKKPLFLGTSSKSPVFRNRVSPGNTANYRSLLARHASYESIESRLVIRGNPQLLEESIMMPSDMTPVSDNNTSSVIQADGMMDSRTIMPSLHRFPGYVKVNVMMPSGEDSEFNDYAERFWYEGWFHLYSIDNSFDNGSFTQELSLFSVPSDVGGQAKLGQSDIKNEVNLKNNDDSHNTGAVSHSSSVEEAESRSISDITQRRASAAKTNRG